MRTARLLFTIVGSGALGLGLGLADEPSSDPAAQLAPAASRAHPTGDRPAGQKQGVQPLAGSGRADGKPSDVTHAFSRTPEKRSDARLDQAEPAPWRPSSTWAGLQRPAGAMKGSPYPSAFNKAPGGRDMGLTNRKTELPHPQTVLSPIFKPATKPALPVAPRSGRDLTSLGGSALPAAKNTEVLNGSGLKRKP